jgi:hypothetical protein
VSCKRKDSERLDNGSAGASTAAPTTSTAAAGEAADDDVEQSDDAADDGGQDTADSVDDGHEDAADGTEDARDLEIVLDGVYGNATREGNGKMGNGTYARNYSTHFCKWFLIELIVRSGFGL